MGWDIPWYSAQSSLDALLAPPKQPGVMHVMCYLRDGDRVFETYWTTRSGVEAMDYSYALMGRAVHGRQESWEDSTQAGRLVPFSLPYGHSHGCWRGGHARFAGHSRT